MPEADLQQAGPKAGQDVVASQDTLTHTDNVLIDTPMNQKCTSLGWQRRPKYLDKIHADMGKRICKLHIDSGPGQEVIFFYQHYNKITLNKMMLLGSAVFLISLMLSK